MCFTAARPDPACCLMAGPVATVSMQDSHDTGFRLFAVRQWIAQSPGTGSRVADGGFSA